MTCIARRNGRRIASLQTTATARTLLTTAVALASVLPALLAQAAPAGFKIEAGPGSIKQEGLTTTITQPVSQTQQPARIVINWNIFSSAAGEHIVFDQPDATAIALNRVTGASASQLMGTLTAKGQVFVLNPNGVLFGAGSQVDVRGLLASTLGMDTASFMAGTYALHGSSSGRVVNQGTLKALDGGYIALVGPTVLNDGSISASNGDALLAAGDRVTLRLEGGGLLGYSMDLGSANALVANRGSGAISATGGRVVLEARAADALSKAVVNHAGLIEAQTLDGSKGSIRLIGDMNVGQSNVSGTLDASAPNGGDGGFIETRAAKVVIGDGTKVTTKAAAGTLGNWLIDSIDFEIAPSTGAKAGSSIGAATLATTLGNSASDVTIGTTTSNAGTGHGDIMVNDVVAWQGFGKLTLQAQRNIVFNAPLAGASVALLYGQASPNGVGADFYFNNGAKIFLNSDNATFTTQQGNSAPLKKYTIVRSLGTEGIADPSTLQGVSSPNATLNYALGADILDGAQTAKWSGGQGFSPLASLLGTFEGLGHEISGLVIKRPDTSIVGLFSSIGAGGQVRNLGITNAAIEGRETVGALAGSNLGTIFNVHGGGAIHGTQRTGGLVGINGGTISSSYSETNVTGNFIAGGLVGQNDAGAISSSYASGAVSAGDPNAPIVPNGPGYAGGLVGYSSGTITGSYASGSVTGTNVAGGLVAENAGTVQDSYANGTVNGNSYVGGLVGLSGPKTKIINSFATGAVQGIARETVHGLVGASATDVVSNSYWNTDASADGGTGQSALGAGVGKTGAQLRQAGTFSGWTMATTGGTDKIWRIYEGNSKPLLRSFLAPLVLDLSRGAKYSGKEQTNLAIPTAGARTGTAALGTDVGTYQPYSNQLGYDISNGELLITPRPLDIKATIEPSVYDGTTIAKATLSDDRITKDAFTTTYKLATFDNKTVGDQTATVTGITLEGGGAGNYTFQDKVTATGKITPFNLKYRATGVDKVYDGTPDATVLMSADKKGKDDVSASLTASFDNKKAGTEKTVTVAVTGLDGKDAGNYTFTPPPATTASITPRPLDVIATAADKVYDGTTAALSILQDNRVVGDILVANGVASFDNRNAGTAKTVTISGISIAGADAANYVYKPQLTTSSASISPRPLAITATAPDKAYDGTTLTSAALADNRVAGDAVTASYQRADFADKNGGQQKTVTVSGIALSGADALNYQANTSVTASASIKPIALSISANPDTRLADGVPYQGGNGVTYMGLLPGENAAMLDGQLRFAGNAQGALKEGVYRITPAGLTSVNYATTFVDGALTIQPLPLGVGLVVAYTEPGIPRPAPYAVRNTGGGALQIVECGMRQPENLLLGGCQSASQPGNSGR